MAPFVPRRRATVYRTLSISTLLLVAALAGCFGPRDDTTDPMPTTPTTPGALPADFVDPLILDHDHSDASLHEYVWRMKELDHHPLGGNNLKSSGAHAVDIQNGWLFVAAYGATVDVTGGVYIFDLKDPEHPELKFHYAWPGSLGGDRSMEVTDDANWIVLGTEATDCAGNVSPAGPGLYLIDFRDKEGGPVLAHYLPGEVHSVTIHRIAGIDYVYALGGSALGGGNIYRIDTTGIRPMLVASGSVPIGHDAAAYDDPITGQPTLYVANVKDLSVYDLSTPTAPQLLGKWALDKDESANHYVHAVAMELVEGKRIIVLESEDWRGNPSPLWVIDAEDFGAMYRIGNWTNPGQKAANAGVPSAPAISNFGGQLIFSTHNPRLENGLVYLSHYHGGIWVLNVSTYAQAENPEIMGYFLPHNDNGGYRPRSGEAAYPKPNVVCGFELTQMPLVFDAEVQNGIAYVADIHTGLYVVTLDKEAMPHSH
jgi:hypothetical protein